MKIIRGIVVLAFSAVAFAQLPKYSVGSTMNGGAPGGTAGGDLSGTFPNPSVKGINGVALSGLGAGTLKQDTKGVPSIDSDIVRGNASLTGSGALLRDASAGTAGLSVTKSSATAGIVVGVSIATSSPATVAATGFYFNNGSGAMTFNLPTIAAGDVGAQFCFRNYVTKTGAITLQAPASTYIDVDGANGTAAGTLVSGGAAGDSACVVAMSTTQYVAYLGTGAWTNN